MKRKQNQNAVLTLHKVKFRTILLTGIILNKKGNQHEDKLMFNVYAFSNESVKYIKHRIVQLKGKLEKHTVVVRNFNILLSVSNLQ